MTERPEQGRVVGCTDVARRARVVRVLPVETGRVGIQPPPGEWFELTLVQVQALYAAARDAARDSRYSALAMDTTAASRACTATSSGQS